MGSQLFASARTARRLDVVVAVWVAVWVVLGIMAWRDIGAQAQLAGDVIKVGTAVKDTGRALGVVGGLPLVGDRIADLAGRVRGIGAEVERSGLSSRDAVERTAVATGLGIGVLPAALVLVLYVPARLRWRRDVRAVAAGLSTAADDAAFDRYLAGRAVAALRWDEVKVITSDPIAALGDGEVRALADAELARLGLTRPG